MTAVRATFLALALTLPGLAVAAGPAAAQDEGRPVTLADLHRIRDVGDPRVSPEGDWVAYTVSRTDTAADESDTNLWMTRWDGSRTVQLTHSDESEWSPRWSPDGRWLAFLSGRDEDAEGTQLWLMSREGGEAERITDFPGGVSDLAWSPDSRRLALVVHDPDPDEGDEDEGDEDADAPPADSARPDPVDADSADDEDGDEDEADGDDRPEPIVIDRFYFKEDGAGFLRHRRDHIHVLDVESRESFQLTDGDYDDHLPAWSPDGGSLAFVSKRGPNPDRTNDTNLFVVDADSGATPRRITSFEGRDGGSWYGGPVWSPDGERIAYTRGERPELMWYGIWELAVVPAEGGEPTVLTAGLDRNVQTPVWSEDGSSLTFLVEDDRTNWLARMPADGGEIRRLLEGRCYVSSFSAGHDGRVALLKSTPRRPGEVWALEDAAGGPVPCGEDAGGAAGASSGAGSSGGGAAGAGAAGRSTTDGSLRKLSTQNDEWLAEVRLAPVEEIDFESPDGTRVGGFLVRPLDGAPATEPSGPHPTLLRLHGGPVWQFFNDFFFEWQLMAARGYAVVAPNPRGSSGRGEDFQKAIFADWGDLDGRDVLAAVDHVVEMGVADPERLGVGGWSYGGILTNALIVQDDRFDAAISGAGMGNMLAGYGHDQYVREWETELGAPWENPELWIELSAPFLQADRIETPTLFMCGQDDWNVPLIASEQMYQALRSLGVETRLVVYPGEDHGIRRPSFQTDRLRRYLDWYDRFLRPGTTAASGS